MHPAIAFPLVPMHVGAAAADPSRTADAMSGTLHAVQIVTLAGWVSLAGVCAVVQTVKPWQAMPAPAAEVVPPPIVLTDIVMDAPSGDAVEVVRPEGLPALPSTEDWSSPPELADASGLLPLSEVPSLPLPRAAAEPVAAAKPTTRASAARSSAPAGRSGASTGASIGAGRGGGGGDASARLASGRMPVPRYPDAARRGGQTGTVLVEFTIDTDGRVVSAFAKQPSPWPLLNEEAVKTVRRWKFPPGGVMKLQRPIVFELR